MTRINFNLHQNHRYFSYLSIDSDKLIKMMKRVYKVY